MRTNFKTMLSELNEQLNFLDLENDDKITKCEKAIEVTIRSVEKLKKNFIKEDSKSQEQEIDFFKKIKPQFTSKLIYYNTIYKIETKLPYGGDKIVKHYLNKELKKLKQYFYNNLDFYNYHRTGSCYLDFKYFMRGSIDIKQRLDNFYFEVDPVFSTSHDFKVAEILAHDLVQVYLKNKLLQMDKKEFKEKSQLNHNFRLNWTGSKVALVELLYALHSGGYFNNGAYVLKEVVAYFESIFNIDLGQYRRVFIEIKDRKSNKTRFIDVLKGILLKRINDGDERF